MNKIEVLAPAGSKEALISAINNGADAVYFGGMMFGARASANNFTNEEIKETLDYAHSLDVLVYVTVNTLIKDSEFKEALAFVKFLYENNCDAIIVQDLGLLNVVRQMYPDLAIHVSTQLNVHDIEQARFLRNLGVKRIVLAREVSLSKIKQIAQIEGLEIEVFVHGALCMSYSGNCFMSSVIGKRSGNRGRCAQPCRMQYELEGVTSKEYLLSPKDLMTIDYVNELIEAGVTSFKIEGRMKRAEYVGLTVKSYREALRGNVPDDVKKKLSIMFNREFTKGYINNETNSEFTNTKSPNHIGIEIGKVIKVNNNYAYIKLSEPLNNKDSIRILSNPEDAITINELEVNHEKKTNAKSGEIIKIRTHHQVDLDALVLKTTDSKLIEELNKVQPKKVLIEGRAFVQDEKLVLEVSDGVNTVKTQSNSNVEYSPNNQFVTRIKEQILKTKSTNYEFNKLEINIFNKFLPIKEINDLRRNCLTELENMRISKKEIHYGQYQKYLHPQVNEKRLFVKVRTENQLKQALNCGVKDILVEDKRLVDIYPEVYYVSPRINSGNNNYDGINNLKFSNNNFISGVYMNIFNAYGVNFMHEQGIKIVGLSIELSKLEMKDLIHNYQNLFGNCPNLMVMAYGYYELMITKHCLINKALGLDIKGCQKCYEKQYYLKDRLGYRFPLINDGQCNLKLLNSKRLHLLNNVNEMMNLGINNILLDFTIEENIEDIIRAYKNAFNKQTYENIVLSDVTNGHYKEGVI
jgi:putative protease